MGAFMEYTLRNLHAEPIVMLSIDLNVCPGNNQIIFDYGFFPLLVDLLPFHASMNEFTSMLRFIHMPRLMISFGAFTWKYFVSILFRALTRLMRRFTYGA